MLSPLTGGLRCWEVAADNSEKRDFALNIRGAAASEVISPAQEAKSTSVTRAEGGSSSSAFTADILSRVPAPLVSHLTLEERYHRCLLVAEECVQPEELKALLERKQHPVAYDGFEPSGRMHIAQGLMKVVNVNRLTDAGCIFVFWVADWFAMLNNKMGGDLNKIRKVGEYFLEVWKSAGMRMDNVCFLWASEEIGRDPDGYWQLVMDIARANNISRIKRCCQIMGRSEGDDQPAAQILYPCMQCADIFYLQADICQLGMDQRKVNMLAREFVEEKRKQKDSKSSKSSNKKSVFTKPVILSHHMLPGLLEGQEKMSKSNPDSAIFMEDTEADVNRKIKRAYCPPCQVEGNPCVSYVERLIFPLFNEFKITRLSENGGDVVFKTVEEFKEAYLKGELHPADLKDNLARQINEKLEPVRQHFATDENAKKLLQQIKAYRTTR